jgi:hypothetical protein
MNIDELVRSARPDASAGWARSNGGRRVLDEVIATAPAGSTSGRTAWERPVARRPALRWSLVGTGLVGAAAAVALVVPAIVSSPDAPTDGPAVGALPVASGNTPGGATTLGPREILLAAATTAEQAPAETGKYWHVKTLNVGGPLRVGTDPEAYWVVERGVEESWDARDAKDASWTGHRDIGVRPRAESDEKAWRAAGSPTKWTLDSDGAKVVLSTRPSPGKLSKDPQAPRYLEDIGQLSLEQVRQLPEDQKALRGWVTSRVQKQMGFAPGSAEIDQLVFGFLSRMLLDTPAAPKVRASAFRILADIPGVRGLGTVKDEGGRSGQGVEFASEASNERLVIDAATHLLLADQISSGPKGTASPSKENSSLVLSAEWSDAAPQVPSIPEQ